MVETPRHAQAKFKYEPELGVFMLSRALTLGLTYDARDVRDLPDSLRHQAEGFFTAATAGTGKRLKFVGWRGPSAALAAIGRAQRDRERRESPT